MPERVRKERYDKRTKKVEKKPTQKVWARPKHEGEKVFEVGIGTTRKTKRGRPRAPWIDGVGDKVAGSVFRTEVG